MDSIDEVEDMEIQGTTLGCGGNASSMHNA
jgi:hypothetical protein